MAQRIFICQVTLEAVEAEFFAVDGAVVTGDLDAFHPHGAQTILDLHPSVFTLERISPDGNSRALCLHNVSKEQVTFLTNYNSATDLFIGQEISISTITLAPYEVKWLKTDS